MSTAGHVSITGNVSANKFIGDGSGLSNLNVQGDRISSATHAVIVNENTGYVSLTSAGTPWGYFSAGWSYLSNLFTNTVSSSLVSATNVSATYVDATRNGTVSGTYGYFRYISGTAGYFSGKVGIGLSNPTTKLEIADGYVRVSRSETNSQPAFFEASASGGEQLTWKYVEDAVASIPADVWQFRSGGSASSNIVFSRFDSVPVLYLVTSDTSGRVGVGTTSPLAKLDVAGTISASDAIQVGGSSLACSSGIAGALRYAGGNIQYCNGTAWGSLVGAADAMGDRIVSGSTNAIAWQDRSLTISTAGSQRMIVGENGNVGIGTSTPGTAMLSVAHSYPTIRLADIDAGSLGSVSGRVEFTDDNGNIAGVVGPQGNSAELVLRNLSGGRVVLVPGSTPVLSALNNGRVGIGWNVITPTATLQVSGSFIVSTSAQNTTPSLYVTQMGQVLVASNSALPGVKLHVGGTLTARDNTGGDARILTYSGNGSIVTQLFSYDGMGGYVGTHSNHPFRIRVNDTDRMVVSPSGNVGIGQAIPLAKLDVGGTISASNAIQVGTSALSCSAGIPGAIRYNGGNLQYCNGTTWTTLGTSAGVTGTGSATAVAFWSGSNALSYDADGFYWDSTNNRLGVGMNTPSVGVHAISSNPAGFSGWFARNASYEGVGLGGANNVGMVHGLGYLGAAAPLSINGFGGNVGVGTFSPTAALQVSGTFIVSTSLQSTTPTLYVGSNGRVGIGTSNPTAILTAVGGDDAVPKLLLDGGTKDLAIPDGQFLTLGHWNSGTLAFTRRIDMNASGHVGISTSNPIAKLDVVGTISASDAIQVGLSSLACSGGIPGAIRYNAGNLQYCNGTIWTTLGVAGGGQEDRIVSGTTNAIAWQDRSLTISTAGSQRMIVGENGHVGIGTSTPAYSLDVKSLGGTILRVQGENNAPAALINLTDNTGGAAWNIENGRVSGSLGFYLAGALGGPVAADRTKLIINSSGRVGINTLSPTATLQVSGTFTVSTSAQTTTPSLYVGTDGRVGIGTDAPARKLEVVDNSDAYNGINVINNHPGANARAAIVFGNGSHHTAIGHTGTGNGSHGFINSTNLQIVTNGLERLRITNGGLLGVSNTSPLAKLDVAGTISASDAVQVGTSSLACSAGIPGAIRYNGGNLQYCNGSAWTTLGTSAGVTGTGSATAVAFWSGPSALTYSDGFYWDNAGKRLGVGTNVPGASVEVSSTEGLRLTRTGGTNAPWISWYLNATRQAYMGYGTPGTYFQLQMENGNNFYIGGGNVGINTHLPTAALQVSGSLIVSSTVVNASPSLYVGTNGNVGIGSASPSAMLTLDKGALDAPRLQFRYVGQVTSHNVGVEFKRSGAFKAGMFVRQDNDTLSLWAGAHPRLSVLDGGNVGISTTTPLAKFEVVGTISASDAIQVGTSSLSCSSGIPGAIRYNGGNLQYCNGTTWTTLGGGGTLTGTGSATAVAFWSGPSVVSYSDGFYWDSANKRLGIGTNTPVEELSLEVSGSAVVRLTNSGTNGRHWDIQSRGGGEAGHFRIADMTASESRLEIDALGNVGLGGQKNPVATLQVSGSFIVSTSAQTTTPSLYVGLNGNVGIGTDVPGSTFSVSGTGQLRLGGKIPRLTMEPIDYDTLNLWNIDNSSGNMRFFTENHTAVGNGTGGMVRMVITSASQVGIGVNPNPKANLDVGGSISATNAIQVGTSALSCSAGIPGAIRYNGGLLQYCNGTSWTTLSAAGGGLEDRIISGTTNVIAHQDRSVTFTTAGAQRMVLGQNGRLGIGLGLPVRALHVSSSDFAQARFSNGSGAPRIEFEGGNGGAIAFMGTGEPAYATIVGYRSSAGAGGLAFLTDDGVSHAEQVRITETGLVGIGTATPTATLQVSGSFIVSTSVQNTTPSLYVTPMGQVLVASDSALPGVKLHVGGTLTARDNTGGDARILTYSGNGSIVTQLFSYDGMGGYVGTHSNHPFRIRVNDTDRMVVSPSGNVGIGQAIPLAKLDVGGTISASNAVQIGTSALACSAGIPGAIRYNGGTLQYCNGTTWTTLGAAGGGLEDRIVSGTTNAIAWQDRSLTISTAGSQRMMVGENGNVGIGTSTPAYSLDVKSLGGTILRVQGENNAPAALINLTDNTGGAAWNIENGRVSGSLGFYLAGTLGGPVAADRTKLIINPSGRVGINTLSPTATLQVSGSFIVSTSAQTTTPSLFVGGNGYVGIGTATPSRALHVADNSDAYNGINVTNNDPGANARAAIVFSNGSHHTAIGHTGTGNGSNGFINSTNLQIVTNGLERLRITNGGLLGVSNTSPLAKLDVAGTISASDAVQVGTSSLACSAGIPGAIRYNGGNLQYCNGSAWTTLGTSAGVTGTGSATAVAFWSGPSALTYSSGFYWDNAGKRLGVGTNVPGASVEVSSTEGLRLTRTGGTNAPWISWYLNATRQAYMGYGTPGTYFQLQMENGNNFYIGGGNVGIKTHLPTATLQVSGSFIVSSTATDQSPSLFVGTDGRVGIGTSSPQSLGVFGGYNKLAVDSVGIGTVSVRGAGNPNYFSIMALISDEATDKEWFLTHTNSGLMDINSLAFGYHNGSMTSFPVVFNPSGDVGISTTTPRARLDVNGSISASDAIQVGTSSLACSGGIPGAIRYNAGALELCNGASWSALGGGSALGDRITSGTLAMVANSATSYVSLSTNGTTWGYLNSANSYLPALTANRVSATNISGSIIQVGNTGASCTSGISGSIRYSSVSSTLEYCNSTAWVSMGPSATTVPMFAVHRNGVDQTLSSEVGTTINWTSKEADSNNNFDLSTDRFTPTVPGLYLLTANIHCDTTNWCVVGIRKNGVSLMEGWRRDTVSMGSTATLLVTANGTTDYFDAFAWVSGTKISGLASYTNFRGALISMAGGGSGGGSDNLGDHTATQNLDMATFNISNGGTITGSGAAFGGLNVTGASSQTTISTSLVQVGAGMGAACGSNLAGAIRYNISSNTLQVCNSAGWVSLASGTTGDSALGDRIVSGTSNVIVGQNQSVTISTNNQQRMVVGEDGRVGIGTATPAATLDVGGVTHSTLQLGVTLDSDDTVGVSIRRPLTAAVTAAALQFCNPGAGPACSYIYQDASLGGVSFKTNNGNYADSALMHMTSDGKFGIGVLTPTTALTVSGSISASSYIRAGSSGEACASGLAGAIRYSSPNLQYCNGSAWTGLATGSSGDYVLKAGDTMTGRLANTGALAASQAMATASTYLGAFEARSQGSGGTAGAAFIAFHRPSAYAVYFGIDTDDQLKIGGWSMGGNAYKVWHANNDGSGSGLDADLLDGLNSATAGTASTIAARDGSGNLTAAAFLYSSDQRLKKSIIPLAGGLAKLDAITPVAFTFVSDTTDRQHLGVIAQEVEKVYPQAVITADDGYKKVDYPALVPVLIGAVKELKAANDTLTERAVLFERINDGLRRWNHQLRDDVDALKAANGNLARRLEALEAGKANAR